MKLSTHHSPMQKFDSHATPSIYPELQGLFASAWLDSIRTDESAENLEKVVAERERAVQADLDRFKKKVNDFAAFLEVSAPLIGYEELDRWVDFFLDMERDMLPGAAEIVEDHFSSVRKSMNAGRRDLHMFLDRYIAGFRRHHTQLLAICRDVRWRLMASRAEHQPSTPIGSIQGEATDLDAYLRSLG